MPFKIRIINNSTETITEQICKQIELGISLNELSEGESIPSVRALALELKVNPNTVAKSFQLLVQRGTLVSQKGKGYFVSGLQGRFSTAEQKRQLKQAAEQFVAATRPLGLPKIELLGAIESLLPKESNDE